MQDNGQDKTLEELKDRIENFSVKSIWLNEEGNFVTNPNLPKKVDAAGKMRLFVGNTVVFAPDFAREEQAKEALSELENIRELLYKVPRIRRMFAERLETGTFHMTLHDLESGVPGEDVFLEERICSAGKAAKSILNRVKLENDWVIEMRASRLFNMVNTSVVLGLEPCTEADFEKLMELYREFQDAKPLAYPLTPHITMAYYRPGEYDGETAGLLQMLFDLVNSAFNDEIGGEERAELKFRFALSDLKYQRFRHMNDYYEVPGDDKW